MLHSAILLLAGALGAAPAEEASADLRPSVVKLVRQLDATEKSRRDDAEHQLLKLGTVILPLRPETEGGSAEIKLRLSRVRTQLEKLRGEEEVRGRAVTINGQELALGDVLATVEQQTGDKLVDYRQQFGQQADPKKLTLALDKQPFWPAVDQILDSAGMTIYQYSGEEGLALVNRAGTELPRYQRGAYAGAFRFEATDITARRDLRDPTGQNLRLQVEVAWEPRLKPIALSQAGESITAVGDTGAALQSGPSGEQEVTVNPGDTAAQIPLTFALPPRDMTKIASLKGSLSVMLPGPVEAFRFEKLAAGAKGEQQRAGVKVILEQVRQNNFVWEVRMRIVFDKPGRALESHRTWVLHNDAYLETEDKRPIKFAGLETTRQGENEVGIAYLFDVEEIAGHTFVYKTPAVLTDAVIPYELREIMLP